MKTYTLRSSRACAIAQGGLSATMDTGLTALRDIHGLDPVPWWPLAPGWWYLLGLVALVALAIGIRYWLIYHGPWLGWRGDARRQLRSLKKAAQTEEPREVAGRLSELLRRIAMARTGRREAAGLTGDLWLHWLEEHDNTGFDWEQRAQVLLVAPYMPPAMAVKREELAELIHAAIRWIDASKPVSDKKSVLRRLQGLMASILPKDESARV
ncbi:MAG: DUF4381 domain-containing protein [Gammaproteobacteria bacterium]